jgi:hypothetical protein
MLPWLLSPGWAIIALDRRKALEIIGEFPARTGVDGAAIHPYFPPAFGISPGSAGAFC